MRREYYVCPFRNVPDVFDSYGPSRLQGLDHVRVVHDLVFQIHRGTESLERDLHHVDRPIDARAETTRGRKIHFHESDSLRRREGFDLGKEDAPDLLGDALGVQLVVAALISRSAVLDERIRHANAVDRYTVHSGIQRELQVRPSRSRRRARSLLP